MDLSLRPETLAALDAYRARRNSLTSARGLLIGLGLALALLGAIALLDRAWLMPEVVRPWASLLAYAGCGYFVWKLALRFLLKTNDTTGTAARAETLAPELREKLLSAVELSHADASTVKDSPEFRARLQDEVAVAVKGVDWVARQPAAEMHPWLKKLGWAAAITAVLCFVPRLHYAGFLARAALPFANLERPSSVRISIVDPTASETMAPMASEVTVVAEIEGEAFDHAYIEFGEFSAKSRKMELSQVASTRYEARLPVGQNDLRFRVLASDGISSWQTFVAKARPRVLSFAKVVTPPSYVKAAAVSSTAEHGDVEALEGSTVAFTLTCNQPIAEAKVILNPESSTHPAAPAITISSTDAKTLTTTLPVDAKTESWTLMLKSAETGFTNEDASSWRVVLIPDLPPVIAFTEPADSQADALPDDNLRLAGSGSDDVGLASVTLKVTVNAQKHESFLLAEDKTFSPETKAQPLVHPSLEAEVQHMLAIGALQVKTGDSVVARLIAKDLKGQSAESPELRIIIIEQTTDPKKRAWAEEQRRLAQAADKLNQAARDLAQAASRVKKTEKAQAEKEESVSQLKSQLNRVQQQAEDLWERTKQAAQVAPTQADAEDLQAMGKKLAQLRHEQLDELAKATKEGIQNTDPIRKEASKAASIAEDMKQAAEAFAREDTAQIAAQTARQHARQQAQLVQNALPTNRDAEKRPQWQEQAKAAIATQQQLAEEFAAMEQAFDEGRARHMKELQKQLAERAQDLADSLDKAPQPNAPASPEPAAQPRSPEHLYSAADNLRQRTQQVAEQLRGMAEESMWKARDMRRRLNQQENAALVALEEAKASLHDAAKDAANPPKREKPSKDGKTDAQRAEQQLASAAKQLQDQAELRQANALTNQDAATDANRASRAVDALKREAAEAGKDATKLEAARAKATELAKIARTLDAAEKLETAQEALTAAALAPSQATAANQQENAKMAADSAQLAREALTELPKNLQQLQADPQAIDKAWKAQQPLQQAADQLNEAARRMAQQEANGQAAKAEPQPAQLADAKTKAAELADALAPVFDAAREQLSALAPKVSEMMKTAAQDLNAKKEDTLAAKAEADALKPTAEVGAKAEGLMVENEETKADLSALQAALKTEANAANLSEDAQRMLARTADVAMEQMRQKTPEIGSNLQKAARSLQSAEQAQSLDKAAQAQAMTAESLAKLGDNIAALEAGKPVSDEALAALTEMEAQLGVQDPLNEAYDEAAMVAAAKEKAQTDAGAALADLEAILKKSPTMQKALAKIGKQTAETSEAALTAQADQPAMLGSAAEAAAQELARVARHQERLGQEEPAATTAEASKQLATTAQNTKKEPANATSAVAQLAKAAAASATQSAASSDKMAPDISSATVPEVAKGQDLAQALDELDKMVNGAAQPGQPQAAQQGQQGQQAQQGQQQGQQQSAQQAMASAQQNQSQQMAQARAQGQVPGQGQQQGQQQLAKGKGQSAKDGSSTEDNGNKSGAAPTVDLVEVPVVVITDWGKLPSKVAEDLTEATRQEAAPEYRTAIENYYKALAAKARK